MKRFALGLAALALVGVPGSYVLGAITAPPPFPAPAAEGAGTPAPAAASPGLRDPVSRSHSQDAPTVATAADPAGATGHARPAPRTKARGHEGEHQAPPPASRPGNGHGRALAFGHEPDHGRGKDHTGGRHLAGHPGPAAAKRDGHASGRQAEGHDGGSDHRGHGPR